MMAQTMGPWSLSDGLHTNHQHQHLHGQHTLAHPHHPHQHQQHHHQQHHSQHQQQHQQQQQQQHHQQQQVPPPSSSSNGNNSQQAYNMNSSDYSSSTYHVYDQILGDQIIDDLIIIKQERMKKKLEREHRRHVILFSLAIILLVGLLMFVLVQLFRTTASSGSPSVALGGGASFVAIAGQQARNGGAGGGNNVNNIPQMPNDQPTPFGRARPPWAPSGEGETKPSNWQFDPSQFAPGRLAPVRRVFATHEQEEGGSNQQPPSNRVILPGDQMQQQQQQQQQQYASQQQQLAKCLATNCSNNGQCNAHGRCLCYAGFVGLQCEYHVSSAPATPLMVSQLSPAPRPPATVAPSDESAMLAAGKADENALCALMLNNCNGNGQCTAQGQCKCLAGFMGDSCQLRDLCHGREPGACSNQGACQPETGLCACNFGFKGPECELRDEETWQRLLNCSHHGKYDYILKKCNCDQGYSGADCSEERCEPAAFAPTGGSGNNNNSEQQAGDCGPNGLYDCQARKCVCRDGYSGERCQVQRCSPQCLRNGQCLNGACACQPGFYGKHCTFNGCPNQCSGRGQCVKSAAASETAGQQQQQQVEWRCQCPPGSTGDDCGTLIERQCDDGIDNDSDGLVDCADSECCGDIVCQNSTLCMKSPDPLDILMRKQPPPPTSSFFQRMQFLIEKFSSQIYSNAKDFNDSSLASKYVNRASVIRGRVTYQRQGITGVRVSVAGQINLGITLTRDGGHFDLMVNGGGAVVLEFRREPFATLQKTIRVPWNEIVLMDSLELQLDAQVAELPSTTSAGPSPLAEPDAPICSAHNYRQLRPLIVAAPKSSSSAAARSRAAATSASGSSGKYGAHSSHPHYSSSQKQPQQQRAVILRDSATVQQAITLPNSGAGSSSSSAAAASSAASSNESVSIVYISSRANEFMSTISLQLTPPALNEQAAAMNQEGGANKPPSGGGLSEDLKLVHVKIIIEGNLFEQSFEPQANLSFVYAWNRRNVYRQKSFGLSTAAVSVGYEYFDCKHVIWTTKHVQLPGHDLSISDIGNQWNLNIHHRYNYRDAILQRGDGHNYNLKSDKPRVVQPIMGDGYQRQPNCPFCDGATSPIEQKLLKPQALVAGADGSLYVGDFNLVRRIEPAIGGAGASQSERAVRTVLELPTSRVPNKYALAMNLADARLYLSDTERHQVFMIRERDSPSAINNETLAGEQPSDSIGGGGGSGGSLVPVVGNGVKCKLTGDAGASGFLAPAPNACGDGQQARMASLIEPKALAFDLAGRMYIADGPNVRLVDVDQKIYTLLGDYGAARHSKFPCTGEAVPMHKFAPRNPLDLALSPLDETLHVLDENVVYKITQDKRVQVVAGRPAHCARDAHHQHHQAKQSRQQAQLRATELQLQSAQAIAFNQNGDLFISEDDQKQLVSRVLLVSPEDDTVSLFAGQPSLAESTAASSHQQASGGGGDEKAQDHNSNNNNNNSNQQQQDKQRSSNFLPGNQLTRARDYKFNSVAAIAIDQQGNLLVADKIQLRVLSIEPDLPQMNALNEYEIQAPDNADELLVFNRYGHHVATRELAAGQPGGQRANNKYTFSYNVNTSFGQLASVSYANGNKISIYRDGPHHSVKMIETAFGGQCKLDISRNGQVHSIATLSPSRTQTSLSYHIDGGLLKQSRDQTTGEVFDFLYDEFGRATGIRHARPQLGVEPVECRLQHAIAGGGHLSRLASNNFLGLQQQQHCASLIVAE